MAQATVTGINPSAKSDGSHVLQVKNTRGRATTVVIPATMIPVIETALQRALLERVYSVAKIGELTTGATLPHLRIEQVATGHLGSATSLCIRTPQMGWASLEASDDVLLQMKAEIDVVLSSRVKH
jgi:hypothetical protein